MILLGDSVAELLSLGIVPKKRFDGLMNIAFRPAIRPDNALVKTLRDGNDDKSYQFAVQERCGEILEDPAMWQAVSNIATSFAGTGKVTEGNAKRSSPNTRPLGGLHCFRT